MVGVAMMNTCTLNTGHPPASRPEQTAVINPFLSSTLSCLLVGQHILQLDSVKVVCESIVLLQMGPANCIFVMCIVSFGVLRVTQLCQQGICRVP